MSSPSSQKEAHHVPIERTKEQALLWINDFMRKEYDETTDMNQELRKYILYSNSGSLIKDIMGGVSDERVLKRVKKWFLRRGKPPSDPLDGQYPTSQIIVPGVLKFKQFSQKTATEKVTRTSTKAHQSFWKNLWEKRIDERSGKSEEVGMLSKPILGIAEELISVRSDIQPRPSQPQERVMDTNEQPKPHYFGEFLLHACTPVAAERAKKDHTRSFPPTLPYPTPCPTQKDAWFESVDDSVASDLIMDLFSDAWIPQEDDGVEEIRMEFLQDQLEKIPSLSEDQRGILMQSVDHFVSIMIRAFSDGHRDGSFFFLRLAIHMFVTETIISKVFSRIVERNRSILASRSVSESLDSLRFATFELYMLCQANYHILQAKRVVGDKREAKELAAAIQSFVRTYVEIIISANAEYRQLDVSRDLFRQRASIRLRSSVEGEKRGEKRRKRAGIAMEEMNDNCDVRSTALNVISDKIIDQLSGKTSIWDRSARIDKDLSILPTVCHHGITETATERKHRRVAGGIGVKMSEDPCNDGGDEDCGASSHEKYRTMQRIGLHGTMVKVPHHLKRQREEIQSLQEKGEKEKQFGGESLLILSEAASFVAGSAAMTDKHADVSACISQSSKEHDK